MFILTNKEFKETFLYKYSELDIKLESSNDSETLEKLIVIKSLDDLNKISKAIEELYYKKGLK